VASLVGGSEPGGPGGKWDATATIIIHDQNHDPLSGATVNGSWSAGANGAGQCGPTPTSGQCSITKNNVNSSKSSVTFTIAANDVTHTDLSRTYVPGDNDAPVGDPAVIVVRSDDPPPGGEPPGNSPPTTDDVAANGLKNATSIKIVLTGNDSEGTVDFFRLSTLPLGTEGVLKTDGTLGTDALIDTDYAAALNERSLFFVPATDFTGISTFTYAAKDDVGDVDASPATATINVTEPGGGGTLQISVEVGTQSAGPGGIKYGTADVEVLDDQGGAVSGALVEGTFSGDINEDVSDNTDGSGAVAFTTLGTAQGGVHFTFCVTDVNALPVVPVVCDTR
jgi:hypothetical protein